MLEQLSYEILLYQKEFIDLLRISIFYFLIMISSQPQAQAGDDGFQVPHEVVLKVANQGFPEAQTMLGNMYFYGKGVEQDVAEAGIWFRKAAEQGDIYSQNTLASMYFKGKGVPQSYSEALKWYRRAANQGDMDAQNRLGEMYQFGHGVPKYHVEAYLWFNLAAAAGHPEARKSLKYLESTMRPEDISEAQKRANEWRELHQPK